MGVVRYIVVAAAVMGHKPLCGFILYIYSTIGPSLKIIYKIALVTFIKYIDSIICSGLVSLFAYRGAGVM